MKITKKRLKRIIKEEIQKILQEVHQGDPTQWEHGGPVSARYQSPPECEPEQEPARGGNSPEIQEAVDAGLPCDKLLEEFGSDAMYAYEQSGGSSECTEGATRARGYFEEEKKQMKITKNKLKKIIQEEMESILKEYGVDPSMIDLTTPLPRQLHRSDPRYGRMTIRFESDVHKALYIVHNAMVKSKAEPKFLEWLSSLGYTQEDMLQEGEKIKAELKRQLQAHPDFPGWQRWSQMTGELVIPIDFNTGGL